jgi:hypothetical protein
MQAYTKIIKKYTNSITVRFSLQPFPFTATVETLHALASEFEKFYIVHRINIYVR